MKLRKYTEGDVMRAALAVDALREARDWFKGLGSKKTLEKVRRALKSAEGAQRHINRLHLRAEQGA
jgi:hypothetical protein